MSEHPNLVDSLATYACLGRSGLRVSPLCLGTMTFGDGQGGWDSNAEVSRQVFDRYIEAGGNFIDTADLYTGGKSEELIGQFMADKKNRDELVLATKCTFNYRPHDPNAGGNSRKHILEACDRSLRRLQTDYIDLYWLHAWDTMTPVEEMMAAMNTLVESGKVRYIGLSDTPAWYLARAQTLAEWRGWAKVVALQLEYSLVERNIEREHIPAALELGMGVCPWSPLAGGLLSGKYTRGKKPEEGRLKAMAESDNPVFDKMNDRNFDIVDALVAVAKEIDRHPAQVALNWITRRPGVASTIIGASKMSQLESNLQALEFDIPEEHAANLDEASRPAAQFPYFFFEGFVHGMVTGERSSRKEFPWYRP